MKIRYSYLQQQFHNCDDLWEKLKEFVSKREEILSMIWNMEEEIMGKEI